MTIASPRAKKSLGQHFLRHESICLRIAALLQPRETDHILEIGPGPGALTRALEAGPHASLLLLEKDRHWAVERQRLGGANTRAILMDALRFDWRRLDAAHPCKIIGNLPYNVASPLIWDICSQATGLVRAAFMVQKEVGQRLAARPDSGQYGALSVWVQSYTRPRMEFIVGPGAFSPPPRVDSAVLSFEPLPLADRPRYPRALGRLLHIVFQQRRKQLGSIFRKGGMGFMLEALEAIGLSPQLRPENLTPAHFGSLATFFARSLDNSH